MVATENAVQLPNEASGKENKTAKIFVVYCTMLACMTSILLGYDLGVLNGGQIYIQKDLQISDDQLEILVGIINFCSLFGSLTAGRVSDWIGRKYTTVISCAIFLIGFALMAFAPSYAVLISGRVVAGVGMGIGLMTAPVYTAELAPASTRGFLGSFPEIFVNFGILCGYISNLLLSKVRLGLNWRLMVGIPAIPCVMMAVGVLYMPESPRWLVLQGKLGEARRVLYKVTPTKEEAELRLAAIKEIAHIPADCNDEVVQVPKIKKGNEAWKELLLYPTKSLQHILFAGLGLHFFQQCSGVDGVVIYSTKIFQKAGIRKESSILTVTVLVGVAKTLCILVTAFNVDRFGRRRMLLGSLGGMTISVGLLATGLTVIENNPHKHIAWAVALCVAMALAYVGFFSLGMGPLTWVYSSEIFPLKYRALAMGMAVAVNRSFSGVIEMSFLSLVKKITIGGAFYLFMSIEVVGWLFIFFVLPETRGLPLEEVEDLFGGKHKKNKTTSTAT